MIDPICWCGGKVSGDVCLASRFHDPERRTNTREPQVLYLSGPMTGYRIAAQMTWDMVFNEWEDVAPAQKYFATGEALSHIHYLEHQGLIKRIEQGPWIWFSLQ